LAIDQQQLMEMFYRLECSVSQAHRDEVQGDNWNYIPYSHLRFYKQLKEVIENLGKRPKDLRFLEMGCGLGTKLYIAAAWCKIGTVHGLEINPAYCEIARHMITSASLPPSTTLRRGSRNKSSPSRQVFCGDVQEFDRYHEYDLIYTYGEIVGKYYSVEQKVKRDMKPGAILLSAVLNCEMDYWEKP